MDVPLPRFSVIVPAYQVQAYLPACLDSVLTQSYGDDTLTAHALRAIADRLKETGEPDVLVHAVAHAHRDGRVERDAAGMVLTEFLPPARAHYRRYRTPGAAVRPAGRLRHALIRFGLHRTHRLLRLAQAAAGRLAKAAVKAARAGRSALLRLHYRVQLRLPLRADRAVFAAHRDRGHGCHPGALEQAFRAQAPQVRTAWIAAPEHHRTVPPGPRRIAPGPAAYWTALARSRYVVSNDHLGLVKRPGQVFVQTRHGTPAQAQVVPLDERPPVPSAAAAFARPPLATVPRPAAAPTVAERL